uniref:Putative ixodes 10 kDa peptide protein n=1 Tax=Ixodes ricinus TaxID=34613 RepID=A0A0K8R6F6_IXORI
MLLVLFAVVILPAFQSGALLGSTEKVDCSVPMIDGGTLRCELEGRKHFEDYSLRPCRIKCDNSWVPLPEWVCSGSKGDCTHSARENILKWNEELKNRKGTLPKEWCTCS